MKYYGAIEAGGTKMVLARFDENANELEKLTIPTETPAVTLPAMVDFFREHPVDAVGIGTFGPIDVNPESPSYGCITATPKLAWRDTPFVKTFQDALHVPVGFDTDVNGAALAEATLGAAKGLSSCLYVTVGTGIGGGLIINGKPVHGLVHPELGHQLLRRRSDDPMPDGVCPFHKGCLEGLAAGPAIGKRWGTPAQNLKPDHPAWSLEAEYLAQMCHNAIMSFSPEKIILGGGVMQQMFLFPMIRSRVKELLGGYVASPAVNEGIDDYIVPPGLGTRSGIVGAYLLAREAEKQ